MRRYLPLLPLLALSFPAHAADPRPARPAAQAAAGPKAIGRYDDWQAATHQESGALVCYAFTRATASAPVVPGRGEVVLTVTHRTAGRDAVAISSGTPYPAGAEVQVGVDQATLPFYTSARSAFAREGKAAVTAFEKGRTAVARSPGPRGAQVSDTFSLRGFSAAYDAISKACPTR